MGRDVHPDHLGAHTGRGGDVLRHAGPPRSRPVRETRRMSRDPHRTGPSLQMCEQRHGIGFSVILPRAALAGPPSRPQIGRITVNTFRPLTRKPRQNIMGASLLPCDGIIPRQGCSGARVFVKADPAHRGRLAPHQHPTAQMSLPVDILGWLTPPQPLTQSVVPFGTHRAHPMISDRDSNPDHQPFSCPDKSDMPKT